MKQKRTKKTEGKTKPPHHWRVNLWNLRRPGTRHHLPCASWSSETSLVRSGGPTAPESSRTPLPTAPTSPLQTSIPRLSQFQLPHVAPVFGNQDWPEAREVSARSARPSSRHRQRLCPFRGGVPLSFRKKETVCFITLPADQPLTPRKPHKIQDPFLPQTRLLRC